MKKQQIKQKNKKLKIFIIIEVCIIIIALLVVLYRHFFITNLAGMTLEEATNFLSSKRVELKLEKEFSDSVPEEFVIRTDPIRYNELFHKDNMTVYVSKGPSVTLGKYSGKYCDDAVNDLMKLGLQFAINYEHSDTMPTEFVIRTEPAEGSKVGNGDCINIVVSLGYESIKIPDYTTMSSTEFTEKLSEMGINYQVAYIFDDNIEAEKVTLCELISSNENEPSKELKPNDTISRVDDSLYIVISKGSGTEVPEVVGKPIEEVISELQSLGINYSLMYKKDRGEKGIVVDMDATPGDRVTDEYILLTVSE